MKHRFEILLAAAIILGIACAAWVLVTGPIASLVDSPYESFYAMMTILLVCISIVTGAVIGAWDATREVPRAHHHIRFRTLFHH
jgi:hypothetical protein